MEKDESQTILDSSYHSKEIVSNACSEIFENILRKTYEEENPFKSECETLRDKLSIGRLPSSDLAVIPRRFADTKPSKSNKQLFETENLNSPRTQCTTSSGITQVSYICPKVGNPFVKLLTANESFTYHKCHYSRISQNTIIEEEETDHNSQDIERTSVSTENIRNYNAEYQIPLTESYTLRRDSSILKSFLEGKFEREVSIDLLRSQRGQDITTMTNLQAQGDNNNNGQLTADGQASILIQINFAFYAKLLAFLFTINTIMFFKTFVLPNVFSLIK